MNAVLAVAIALVGSLTVVGAFGGSGTESFGEPAVGQANLAPDETQTQQAECTNNGITVSLAGFDCDVCRNNGIAVWVGRACWGDGPAGACIERICTDVFSQQD